MTQLLNPGRQFALGFEQAFDWQDLVSGAIAPKIRVALPSGAIILTGGIIIETAWNSGTSAVVDVGDITTPNKFLAAANLKSAAGTYIPLTGLGIEQLTGADIQLTLTAVGTAATAGQARLVGSYIEIGRVNEIME